ncbi:MAG: copper amine oxidase N-terminal domain-containing protein [Defluviitaleaceae bacterium]|nr:copper amine oxidase N-terminal domain-containing protein [Defluviitaleaceae bacterium]
MIKKTKRFLFALIFTIALMCVNAYGNTGEIQILLDNAPVSFDVAPQIISGRTMVPMRSIMEALGAEVHWNNELQTVWVPA